MTSPIIIIGRFPPPADGQALATARLADLLARRNAVRRVDVQPAAEVVRDRPSFAPARLTHFMRLRGVLRRETSECENGIILWPSVSPSVIGHFRDRYAVLPSVKPGGSLVAVVHRGNFDVLFRRHVTRASAGTLVRRAAAFVFLTPHLAANCSRWIPDEKRRVISNTIDQEVMLDDAEIESKRRERRQRSVVRLLFMAHMLESKGYLDVLHAVGLLVRRGLPVEAHFAGQWLSARDEKNFEARVHEFGLQRDVEHHGSLESRLAVRELYERCDVLVLPTYYPNEAQPLSIIEALSAGVPVITTRHAGIPEMVSEGREAFFVPPRTPAAIATAVERLADMSVWTHTSAHARRRFCETFAPEVVLDRWNTLLEELERSRK